MSRTIDFDREEVITKAMNVFWDNGYENTSIKDLMDATGLLKGSIYNTFGSKEELFLLCLEAYGDYSRSFHFRDGDAGLFLREFFKRLVSEGSDKDFTKGCLIMNSCLEFANHDNAPASSSARHFQATEENLGYAISNFFEGTKPKKEVIRIRDIFITAAFSIREISKFKKDKNFLKGIANNALREIGVSI